MWEVNRDGAIHALGNGLLLVYGRGADFVHVFGEPYTSQSMLSGTWSLADGVQPTYASYREPGTSVWNHQFRVGASVIGTSREFVLPHRPVYLADLHLEERIILKIPLPEGYACYPSAGNAGEPAPYPDEQLAFVAPDTARILFYLAATRAFLSLRCWGSGFRGMRVHAAEVLVEMGPGQAYLAFASSTSYPSARDLIGQLPQRTFDDYLEERVAADRKLARRILHLDSAEASGTQALARANQLCESVAFLITAQQSADGGIVAGYPFPFAYVRDQYGTCRGLLALGLSEEVRRNIEFRYRKWLRFGTLSNAESMGHDRIRHRHENDDVEQTAYTILQALDYVEASGDQAFLTHIFPMLAWCLAAQVPHLRGGMLPFNGDETYVAGGFLSRSALNDGSMEATLLFIESTRRLLTPARQLGLLQPEQIAHYELLCAETEKQFRPHFLRDGRYVANAPERGALADQPSYRHGVCEGCGPGGWFGWTERTPAGRYLCARCAATAPLPASASQAIALNSVGLLPSFIHSTLIDTQEKAQAVRRAKEVFEEKGYLPTRDDSLRSVGYDAALLLYGLTETQDDAAPRALAHVLDLADSAGAWSEYYQEGRPAGTRCRPWESGISIAAIMHYLRSYRQPRLSP